MNENEQYYAKLIVEKDIEIRKLKNALDKACTLTDMTEEQWKEWLMEDE